MNNRENLAARLDSLSLIMVVLCMCTQVDLHHVGHDTLKEGLGYATKTQAVSLPDIVFAAAALWFGVRTTQLQAWKKLWLPPLPCWALIVAITFSVVHSVTIHDALIASFHKHGHGPHGFIINETRPALAVLAQWTGYFLMAPLLLVNLLIDRRDAKVISRIDAAFKALTWAFGLNLGAAALQLALPHSGLIESLLPHKDMPTGLMGSPNMLLAYLGVATPVILYGHVSQSPGDYPYGRPAAPIALITGLICSLSGLALLAYSVAIAGARVLKLPRVWALAAAVPLALALVWTTTCFLEAGQFRSDIWQVSSATQKVKKQYVEWQAALGWNLPRGRAFATGVGAGNYQLNIGPLYGGLPNEEKMPPDSNNLYLVQAVSIGILGLGTLLWTIGYFYGLAWSVARRDSNWMSLAVVGALTSWLFMNLFHAMIVRGPGLLLAFVFALAVVAAQGTRNPDEPAAV